jgi:hypothetical protein
VSNPIQYPPICPKCGAEAFCFAADWGRDVTSYDEEYYLYCLACGHHDHEKKWAGSTMGDPYQKTSCHYCGREFSKHEHPPEAHLEPDKMKKISVQTAGLLAIEWHYTDGTTFVQIVPPHKTEVVEDKRVLVKHYYDSKPS